MEVIRIDNVRIELNMNEASILRNFLSKAMQAMREGDATIHNLYSFLSEEIQKGKK